MTRRIVILGAGGHARVLLAALRTRSIIVSSCIASEPPKAPWPVEIKYLGSDDALRQLDGNETILVNGIGSTRSSELRQRIYEHGKQSGFNFLSVLHASACIDDSVVVGEGAQVMAGAVVQCGCTLEANVIINTGALIDHDCRIGAHAHVAPGACLAGAVQVGSGVHVGIGARVIQGVTIGKGALIAAGAVVIEGVPPGAVVAGVPARCMRHPQQAQRSVLE